MFALIVDAGGGSPFGDGIEKIGREVIELRARHGQPPSAGENEEEG